MLTILVASVLDTKLEKTAFLATPSRQAEPDRSRYQILAGRAKEILFSTLSTSQTYSVL